MWKEENNKLVLEKNFGSQTELALFFLKVAQLADKKDHHPDVFVSKCSHLRMELYTHTSDSITNQDRALAKEIEVIFNA